MYAIYSCKLYKNSTRKDKIKAAISNPLNAELVSQLKSYLDPEFQKMAEPKKLDPIDFDKPQSSEDSESTESKDNSGHAPSGPRPSGPRPSGGGLSAKFDALLGEEPEEDVSSEGESELDTDSFEGDIEEAEDMQQIGESTTIQSNDSVSLPKISEEIKVILNSDEST